ncbi:MAG: prepilin-type N-terminal cleavage/methylation domain-containing protein [Patescibacteria group bacterium]|nr:prepilin-type N-terminal cleavage/methylation domain-containing protein [Patescibacteria group bacterium]
MTTKKTTAGFSILETIIALAVLAVIAAIGIPIGLDSYRSFILDSEASNLLSILRRAEGNAFSNNYKKDYGVYLDPNNFVLFRGQSFLNRDQNFDENYARTNAIGVNGLSEIVFSPISGLPNVTGTFTLSNGPSSRIISINEQGTLLW